MVYWPMLRYKCKAHTSGDLYCKSHTHQALLMCPEDFLHAVTFCMQACLLTSVSHATVIVIAVVGIIIKKNLTNVNILE